MMAGPVCHITAKSSNIIGARLTAGTAATATEIWKHDNNDAKCVQSWDGYVFVGCQD